jgi:uncharacterized protein YegP (UPF0339 family)
MDDEDPMNLNGWKRDHIQLYRRRDGDLGARVVASNGRKIWQSEGYRRRFDLNRALSFLVEMPVDDSRIRRGRS